MGQDRDNVHRCSSAAAVALANVVVVEECPPTPCSPHTISQKRVRGAEATLVPRKPLPPSTIARKPSSNSGEAPNSTEAICSK